MEGKAGQCGSENIEVAPTTWIQQVKFSMRVNDTIKLWLCFFIEYLF